ncbi:MAG: undecaprenyl-phosphate alpha-N-acetylglucosaminyltransferase [uncultured bacterium]|uniref:Undecaprenyl-phosphate alpha-N-acetylglucosaminyl 1-phosphate transferase n=1 Tax=candidate division WWE3 bacterium RBG_16_37_10 TaxID=1802610 RepID=A0A1F4V2D8_UNCKA|nr:MAG: undecaprenyl-phosphate alpha-N-acetylglucosaminyltransferase [uncultured bacterium]OGC51338.1 MAG: hypothetical protein A2W32_04020 [candidate division WWE3 bacterium RBG_16_37_10]
MSVLYQKIFKIYKRSYWLLNKYLEELKRDYFTHFALLLLVNGFMTVFQLGYLILRYRYLSDHTPVWYTMPWGDLQLDYKRNLFAIPIISFLFLALGVILMTLMKKIYLRFVPQITTVIITFANIALTYSLVRIVFISSIPFPTLIGYNYFQLLLPFVTSFALVFMLAPRMIKMAEERGIVTDPSVHAHPGMLLTKPTARGGGLIFTIGFLIVGLIFAPLTKPILGIYLIVLLLALLGLADDLQNTKARFKFVESPLIRLVLLFLISSLVLLFEIKIRFVGIPFGGIYSFNGYTLLTAFVSVFWVVTILNMLSWANGTDGAYAGIVGIACIFVALLALRFIPLPLEQIAYAKLAVIAAGASFGLIRYTWRPSRVLWGFSAMSAGAVLATLPILINAKVAASIMIILIPFIDALITGGRRILQGKNPLRGDRSHLHHLLIERGWSIQRIAVFYWGTTALFGLIGVLSPEKFTVITAVILSVIVAGVIILLNVQSSRKKQPLPPLE